MSDRLQQFFSQVWYGDRSITSCLLAPLSLLAGYFTQRKRQRYLAGNEESFRSTLPVIVIGNLTVGGTGKTPLVIWLVQQLQARGYKPGIVSRGYGGSAPHYPYLLQASDTAAVAGDEPLMMFQRTGVPVVVDPRRAQAAQALQEQTDCDVIISDDGLQHYALGRTYEVVVVDSVRGLGNGRLLPAGPLRESAERLQQVNAIVINGSAQHPSISGLPPRGTFSMALAPGDFHGLSDGETIDIETIRSRNDWIAVAGIGNPQRFFDTLAALEVRFTKMPFPDHHPYTRQDFASLGNAPVLTTEKDAVKLRQLGIEGAFLPVDARIQSGLIDDIIQAIETFRTRSHHLY